VQRDNCFTWLEHPERAQHLMDQQLRSDWPVLLNDIARSLNPLHETMFAAFPMEYYWSTYQSEWATDIMFGKAATLAHLYPRLVQHGLTTFLSPDVMRFVGRKAPPGGGLPRRLEAEVVSDVKRRAEGVRIKHRVGENSVKMYDKEGSVLRVETTINDVDDFKTFRTPENKPDAAPSWQRMRKGVAHRIKSGGRLSAPPGGGLAGGERPLPSGACLGGGHQLAGRACGATLPAGPLPRATGPGDQSLCTGRRRIARSHQPR
jgi:hypothetical protein